MNHTLSLAKAHVLRLFNQHSDNRLLYHNYQRTAQIVETVEQLGKGNEMDSESIETASLAAWFYATGYLIQYDKPVEQGVQFAQEFLKAQNYPETKTQEVLAAIRSSRPDQPAETPEQELLNDAINTYNTTTHFFHHRPLLRLEWELMQNRRISNIEWNQMQLQDLLQTRS